MRSVEELFVLLRFFQLKRNYMEAPQVSRGVPAAF